MALFGFGKKQQEKERLEEGLEKTRTSLFGKLDVLVARQGSRGRGGARRPRRHPRHERRRREDDRRHHPPHRGPRRPRQVRLDGGPQRAHPRGDRRAPARTRPRPPGRFRGAAPEPPPRRDGRRRQRRRQDDVDREDREPLQGGRQVRAPRRGRHVPRGGDGAARHLGAARGRPHHQAAPRRRPRRRRLRHARRRQVARLRRRAHRHGRAGSTRRAG